MLIGVKKITLAGFDGFKKQVEENIQDAAAAGGPAQTVRKNKDKKKKKKK